MSVNVRKVAVVGCGFVGSATAFALMQSGLFSEMVLVDVDKDRAEGEALDISHGMPLARPVQIYAGSYDDASDAAIIIITAGANQKPGETRLDLVKKNAAIFKSIMPEFAKRDCKGIMLVVANPVDVLTYAAIKYSNLPVNRVIGSGTVLDTARLKYLLGEHLKVDSRSIHAFIIGEHGDSEFAAWSSANVSGVPLHDFCEMRGHVTHEKSRLAIEDGVRNSAYEIIKRKHATYYGIAMAVKRICEAIIRDEKSVLPVSSLINGLYGINDVTLSLPAIIGKDGVEDLVPIRLSAEEHKKLSDSAEIIKGVIRDVL
ncbi:MAG: L-lactate dehydrogenase [Synergistaceae bacterium]|nr:L-lactate dehydrogenase [Synergistaceae bacterium]